MPLIEYPDIPDVPGVPPIPRLADDGIIDSQDDSFSNQEVQLKSFKTQRNWGIFDAEGNALGNPNLFTETDDGKPARTVSTNSLEMSKKMRISEFPVEQGTFATYNKVDLPANPVVTLAYGGTVADRSEFLRQIEVATDSLDLYSVVTPEVTYINFSVESYSFPRRHDQGANLLIVAITLKQIRQVSAQFTSSNGQINDPKSSNAEAEVDNGKVQTTATDDATNKALVKKGLQ